MALPRALLCALGGPLAAQTPVGPPPSAGHALVWHDSLGAVLLVNAGLGGMRSPPRDTPTTIWRWNGGAWEPLDSGGPRIRNLGGVAYDADRNVLVLYGGTYDADLSYGDTWEWRPDSRWRHVQVSGPGLRDHTRMVYDPVRRRTVLFGGQARLDSFPADTWLWDGRTWERRAAPGPAGRVHHAMAWDPVRRAVVLFGGIAPQERRRLGDTWAWDGERWQEVAPAAAPRTHAHLAAFGTDLLLIGGMAPGQPPDAIARWQTTGWRPDDHPAAPLPRYLTAAATDPRRGQLLLFGGGRPGANGLLADTWAFDGTDWRRLAP